MKKERCPQWQYTSQKSFTIAALVGEENLVDLIQFHVATFPIFVFSVKVDEVLEQKVTSVAIVLERPCNLRNAWTVLRTGRASKGSKPKNPMNRLIWLESELVTKIRRVEWIPECFIVASCNPYCNPYVTCMHVYACLLYDINAWHHRGRLGQDSKATVPLCI